MFFDEPTAEQKELVKDLVVLGCPLKRIAQHLSVDMNQLMARFSKEIHNALDDKNRQVMNALFRNATTGDTKAQVFWMQARAGWNTGTIVRSEEEKETEQRHKGLRIVPTKKPLEI